MGMVFVLAFNAAPCRFKLYRHDVGQIVEMFRLAGGKPNACRSIPFRLRHAAP
jgi:hypothetical protein